MGPRVSTRTRPPDHSRPLRVIKTYEKFAEFEASFNDITHQTDSADIIAKRAADIRYEASKTLDVLKQKQPVRIPETKGTEESRTADTVNSKGMKAKKT